MDGASVFGGFRRVVHLYRYFSVGGIGGALAGR
jgi:hypothetical protein